MEPMMPSSASSDISEDSDSDNISIASTILQQIQDWGWVQCEHNDCLKWRRIPTTQIDQLSKDASWFCAMNTDPAHSLCAQPEEDYKKTQQLLRKLRLKFVISELYPGTLVWASLKGYCRWPAMVSLDPQTGYSCILDDEEDPTCYHVEFLGDTHSHAWVGANWLTVYSPATDTQPPGEQKKQRKVTGGKRRRLSVMKQRPPRTEYRGNTVESAVLKANQWLQLTTSERLKSVSFPLLPAPDPPQEKKKTPSHKISPKSKQETPQQRQQDTKPSKQKRGCDIPHQQNSLKKKPGRKPGRSKSNGANVSDVYEFPESPPKRVCPPGEQPGNQHQTSKSHKKHVALQERRPRDTVYCSTSFDCVVPDLSPAEPLATSSLSQCLEFTTPLQGHSKEEKLNKDFETYRRHQDTFERSVRAFMAHHQHKIHRLPFWQSVPVSLYQLFLAVHDRGGYKQVTENKKWANIYRELTGIPTASGGGVPKSFYERNLLPYEAFVEGKPYLHLFKQSKASRDSQQLGFNMPVTAPSDECRPNCALPEAPPGGPPDATSKQILDVTFDSDSDMSGLADIQELIQQVTADHLLTRPDTPPASPPLPQTAAPAQPHFSSSLPVTFCDESPNVRQVHFKLADTASEFGAVACVPEESAQRVPVFEESSVSNLSSDNTSDEQVLHELQVLQQGLDELISEANSAAGSQRGGQ